MPLLLERAEDTESPAETTRTSSSSVLQVTVGPTGSYGFVVDPSGAAPGREKFLTGRKHLPRYFDWLQVPSARVLPLVDQLMPPNPKNLPPLPFYLLVSPRWSAAERSIEVFVNMSFRRYNELLVRVPSWSQSLMGRQPIERWVGLQPHLARLARVGFIGVHATSGGRRTLEVIVRVEDLRAEEVAQIATLAGAPAGRLLHLWQTLSPDRRLDPGPTLLSIRLGGEDSLDVGVTFPGHRAGSSSEIQKWVELLARIHDLDASNYFDSIVELRRSTGREPEHTSLGFSSEDGRVNLEAELTAPASPDARHFHRWSLCRALADRKRWVGASLAS